MQFIIIAFPNRRGIAFIFLLICSIHAIVRNLERFEKVYRVFMQMHLCEGCTFGFFPIAFAILRDVWLALYYGFAFPTVRGACILCIFTSRMLCTITKQMRACRKRIESTIHNQNTTFHHLMDLIGPDHVYSYLEPKDILSLSLVNHTIHANVNANLIRVCKQQLPL